MLTQAIRFLSLSPGDLAYYLVVLFAIGAIARMTWVKRHTGHTRRWAIAAGGLAACRLLLILSALLAAFRAIPSLAAILPPLERLVEVLSLGLLAWAFLPVLQDHPRAGRVLLLGNLILALTAYAWLAPRWFKLYLDGQGVYYNGTADDVFWGIWALALAALATLAAPVRRRDGWATSLIAFGLMAASHALHLLLPDIELHTAEWVRLGNLIAYPLFAALVLGQIEARESPLAAGRVTRTTANLWPVAETCRAIAEGRPLAQSLARVASAVAQAAHADLVAIGLPGDAPGTVKLAAIHNPGAMPQHGDAFPLDAQPTIKQAIASKAPMTCPSEEAGSLTSLLGIPAPRPLLIQPLVYERETVGVLIVSQAGLGLVEPNGNSFAHSAQAAADQLAFALGAAHKTSGLTLRADALSASLRDQETRTAQARLAFEAELARAQADLQNTLNQLNEAQQQAAQHQKRAAEIAALVDLQAAAPQEWQEQARRLNVEREHAIAEAQALHEQIEQLLERQAEHEQAIAQAQELQEQIEKLSERQAALEAELASAQEQLASQPEPVEAQEPARRDNGGEPEPNSHEVIASMAQELRTPMTSISGYTDLLLAESAGILGAMQRQFLQRVKANIERMSGMLDDLVRVTAIDQHLKLQPEPINLVEIIEEVITGSSAQFRERNIALQLDLTERLPLLSANRDSLYQILSHLLSNACLCSQPGSQVTVSAHTDDDRQHVTVSITDTGGGISPTDQLRVFARRYRADNALVEGLGDTGIGLSIAKTLVEAHGGRIWVNSQIGQGSTFTFMLKAAAPAQESAWTAEETT